MDSYSLIPVAALATAFGVLWEQKRVAAKETREKRARCGHAWGPVYRVKPDTPLVPRAWVRHCTLCGEQLNCNEDGSPYKPGSRQ